MGIGKEKLEPVNACLRGFLRERVLPPGLVQLVLTLGDPPCQATTTVRFLIVDAPSAYNMLLGRPSLNAIRVVPSSYHMVIKFPTTNGVRMVRGNQRISRECYSASMKQNTVDNIYMNELDMRDELTTRPAPSEELEPVQLGDQPEHLIYIQVSRRHQKLSHLFSREEHGGIHLETGRHGWGQPNSDHPQVKRQSLH